MIVPFVDLREQYQSIQDQIDTAVHKAISSSSFIGGELVSSFENQFAKYIGMNHCIGCANGSDALEIALRALEIGDGDEVIVPALTWISTAGAVKNVGAEPIFVDVLSSTRNIDSDLIEDKITQRTKAIIPVHLYGLPADMKEIMTIAKRHSLKVIEDCAQAHGAAIDGKRVGTFGDVATFSFYPGKNLGAYGDAGCIVTNDAELSTKCRMLGNHGQLQKHNHKIIGRNSRLDSLQAAILSVKLSHLDQWTEKRIAIANTYSRSLKVVTTPWIPDGFKHVFHLYVIEFDDREGISSELNRNEIGSAIHYPKPLPFLECFNYKSHPKGEFSVAEKLCSRILSIPMYAELTEMQIERVVEVINNNG